MTPLLPFAAAILGAIAAELTGQTGTPQYGAVQTGKTAAPTSKSITVAPTRFTQGTALTTISRAQRTSAPPKQVLGAPTPAETAQAAQAAEAGTPAELEEEPPQIIDPVQVVDDQIELELLIDSIGEEVLEDMGVGEYDPDFEDEGSDEEFGRTSSIFSAQGGWGLARRR